jgi:SEC-C motif domain protein
MNDCPCGSNSTYTDCCGMLINGTCLPDTAEDLMRSRYSAFVFKEWDYLEKTAVVKKSRESLTSNQEVSWKRLEIFGSKQGQREDSQGEVTFAAYFTENEEEKVLRETSKFQKIDGRWLYDELNSSVQKPQPKSQPAVKTGPSVRDKPKVGRNSPCSCGSGKKFKKCCGK